MKKHVLVILLILAFLGLTKLAPFEERVALALDLQPITGSGTIEADTIRIAPETGGRVVDVTVTEGMEVTAGQPLVQLDASPLIAQRTSQRAAVETARANLAAVMAGPQPEDIAVAQAELAQAQAQRDGAYALWQQMLKLVNNPQELLIPIQETRAQIAQAEGAVEQAKAELRSAQIQEEAAARDQVSPFPQIRVQIAQKQRQAAEIGVQIAEARLRALQTQLSHLQEQYDHPVALEAQAHQAEGRYHVAEAAVDLARAKLAAVQAPPRPEEIAVAQAQLRVAESALGLLDVQIDRLTLTAPKNGVITKRTADPGEVATPGKPVLELSDLDHVTLRLFIPETQIGRVRLGQSARVTIDSVATPFAGTVTFIAHEAEFTPKNVQTEEERVNLVFAVEISIDNPEHILKPGMPADAEILP